MKYDSVNIKFIDLSVKFEHAIAMDDQMRLYGWGCNLQKRAGFKEDIFDGVYEPRRITFYEPENLIPLKISCGFDHSLILFKDNTSQQQKLYSIG
jgi:alpha-tubulin suppressor-like RCC1 family protein